jgi:hypothetical protein
LWCRNRIPRFQFAALAPQLLPKNIVALFCYDTNNAIDNHFFIFLFKIYYNQHVLLLHELLTKLEANTLPVCGARTFPTIIIPFMAQDLNNKNLWL